MTEEKISPPDAEVKPTGITVYGRPYCPGVPGVLRLLDEAGVAYEYVNIRQDFEAAARLRQITGGYESVPTLVFPDGRTLIEPGRAALRRALQEADPRGDRPDAPAAAARPALRRPIYWLLALIALVLVVAFLIAIQ